MAECFISYSRKDIEFARQLKAALINKGKDVWLDESDIPPTVSFKREIEEGIIKSNALIFIISPDSVTSEWCLRELNIAVDNSKRLIPIRYRDIEDDIKPKALEDPNWIDCNDPKKFEETIEKVVYSLETDFEHVSYHTSLQVRATEWDNGNRNSSLTLRGNELDKAEKWLVQSGDKEPIATELHGEYVLASRRDASARQRRVLSGVVTALVVAIVLGGVAYGQFLTAQEREHARATQQAIAEESKATAISESDARATQQAIAESEASARATQQALAEEQTTLSEARLLAAQGKILFDEDPIMGTYYTLQALSMLPESQELNIQLRDQLNYLPSPSRKYSFSNEVTALRISPNSNFLVVSTKDDEVLLIDIKTGEKTLLYSNGYARDSYQKSIQISSDEQILVVETSDRIIAFDIEMNEKIIELEFDNPLFLNVSINADGTRLGAVSGEKMIEVWDLISKEIIFQKELDYRIVAAMFNPINNFIVVTENAREGSIQIWNSDDGSEIKEIPLNIRPYYGALSISSDGWLIAVGSWDGKVLLWDSSWHQFTPFEYTFSITSICFIEESKLVVGTDDGFVIILDPLTMREEVRLNHKYTVEQLLVSPDGNFIISRGENIARIWDTHNWIEVARFRTDNVDMSDYGILASRIGETNVWILDYPAHEEKMIVHHDLWEESHWVDPEGLNSELSLLLSVSADNTARVWDMISGEEKSRQIHKADIYAGALRPDGKIAVSASRGGELSIWDVESGNELRKLQHGPDTLYNSILKLEFNEKGSLLFSYQYSDDPRPIYFTKSGKLIDTYNWQTISDFPYDPDVMRFQFGDNDFWLIEQIDPNALKISEIISQETNNIQSDSTIKEFAISSNGHWISIWLETGEMQFWRNPSNNIIFREQGLDSFPAFSFSNNSEQFAYYSSKSSAVEVFDLGNLEEPLEIPVNSDIFALIFSKNGNSIAGFAKSQIIVWEIDSGKQKGFIQFNPSINNSALSVLSSDLRFASLGGRDGYVKVWNLYTQDLINDACFRIPQDYSKDFDAEVIDIIQTICK